METNENFVIYGDTDSCYITISPLIEKFIDKDKWESLSIEKKVEYINKIAKVVEKYVNTKSYENVQINSYNSQVKDFKISFNQESICKSFLIVAKKKYGYHLLSDEGHLVDKIKFKGLEIVRGETPIAIKPMLTKIMEMLLKNESDDNISKQIKEYKKELKSIKHPEEIAVNITINNISKYIKNGVPIKGTPFQLKGVSNYRMLLKELKIENEYEDIHDGNKAKVIYVKPNKFGISNITFDRWPSEFNKVLIIDYDTQVNKYFIKKIENILKAIGKESILNEKTSLKTFFI